MVSSHWQACDVRTIAFAAVGSLSIFPIAHLRHRLGTSTFLAEHIGPESSRHPVVPSSRHPIIPSSRYPVVRQFPVIVHLPQQASPPKPLTLPPPNSSSTPFAGTPGDSVAATPSDVINAALHQRRQSAVIPPSPITPPVSPAYT